MIEWRPAPGFPAYEVSEFGQVRRLTDGATRKAGHMPRGQRSRGYHRYKLMRDGERVFVSAHRLVCEAWHGPPDPMRPFVAHWDGVRDNNHYTNLRWTSQSENLADRYRHGTHFRGERNPRAKLTAEQVSEIRAEFSGQYGQVAELARRFDMSHSAMWSVCKGDHWSGVN